MARLARPGGTLATFTSAGFVRRGLQEAGFTMQKRKGFGRKREMLIGEMARTLNIPARTPWFARTGSQQRDAAIIGGGIASALLALALLRRGWQVTLYCADNAPAEGASGNRQGALYPLLSQHDPALARFFRRHLPSPVACMTPFRSCSTISGAASPSLPGTRRANRKSRRCWHLDLPAEIAAAVSAQTVAQIAGVETGAVASPIPPGLALSAAADGRTFALAATRGLRTRYNVKVTTLADDHDGWQLNAQLRHKVVVLANGHHLTDFPQTARLPAYPVGGQVSHIPTTPALSALRRIVLRRLPDATKSTLSAALHRRQLPPRTDGGDL